ncbi:conjugal transfer protein TrbL family protein [Paenibacillus jiagnxiensis]|uniref:conjugal transfer protein TrbL family protein n=1 Tax=Paenibacillus jiagnxiensis TaxID=3228926 RepID=UPI0033B55988
MQYQYKNRIYKVFTVLPLLLGGLYFLFPDKTYALGLGDILVEMVVTPLREGTQDLITNGLAGVARFISGPTSFHDLPFVYNTMAYAKYIALSLLTLNVLKEIIKSMIDEGYGQGGKPMDLLAGQAIKSVAMIYLSQWILEDVLIAANNALLPVVSKIDGNTLAFTEGESARLAGDVVHGILASIDSIGILIMRLVFLVILGIGFIILAITGGIRMAQLAFLMVIGPFLAVSLVDKGESFNTWVRESVAVVFTQLLQVWLLGYLIYTLNRASFWDMMTAIGILVLMIGGPTVIKPYIHSTGAGGAVIGAGRTVAYQLMIKGAVRR